MNMKVSLKINDEEIDKQNIDDEMKFDVLKKVFPLEGLQSENIFNIAKEGKGVIYYDLNLSYYLPSEDIKARDEGIAIERQYYFYDEYKRISSLKSKEWTKYLSGDLSYTQLEYARPVVDYLDPVKKGQVGQLLLVYNKNSYISE